MSKSKPNIPARVQGHQRGSADRLNRDALDPAKEVARGRAAATDYAARKAAENGRVARGLAGTPISQQQKSLDEMTADAAKGR